jgi:molybdopterin converting factor small subunit
MARNGQRKLIWLLTGAVTALVVIGALLLGAVKIVSATRLTEAEPEVATRAVAMIGAPGRGYIAHGGGFGGPGFGGKIDYPALLADALGVTVEELQAAQEAAHQAALEQALAEGLVTQEQLDRMLSLRAVRSYLDRDTLLAEALGMSVAELQAAYEDGATLSTLMSDRGIDAATLREALTEAHSAALARAVADGVITQEQADELQDGCGLGLMPGAGRLPRGMGGMRGRGGLRDRFDGDSDIGLRLRGRLRGDDTL